MTGTDNFRFVGVSDGFEALEVGTVDAFADSEVSAVGLGGRLTSRAVGALAVGAVDVFADGEVSTVRLGGRLTSTTISEVVFAGGELCIGL